MVKTLQTTMGGMRWSWPHYYVHIHGGHDPTVLAYDWSLTDVYEAYFELQIGNLLG